MTLNTSTLRPGLLVSLKTSLRGNVKYDRVDLEDRPEISKWETTRVIADPDEYERGKKAQSRASSIIRRECSASAFGLLCTAERAWRLEDAIAEARAVVDQFNASAQHSHLAVYVIAGKIAATDEEAVRAINSEVRDLIDTMREGVANFDVKVIRDAANKARQLGQVLSPDAQVRIQFAIDAARGVAKDIVKAGEAAALEVDKTAIRRIAEQRTAFLDFSEAVEVSTPATQARAIDLNPEDNNNAL